MVTSNKFIMICHTLVASQDYNYQVHHCCSDITFYCSQQYFNFVCVESGVKLSDTDRVDCVTTIDMFDDTISQFNM